MYVAYIKYFFLFTLSLYSPSVTVKSDLMFVGLGTKIKEERENVFLFLENAITCMKEENPFQSHKYAF